MDNRAEPTSVSSFYLQMLHPGQYQILVHENTIIVTWDCIESPELKAAAILAEALLPSDSFDPKSWIRLGPM